MRDVVFGFVFGVALTIAGMPFTTWQYWLLLLLAVLWRFTAPALKE